MTKFRLTMTAVVLGGLLSGSQATAAEGPLLAPGKPAGVQTAQRGSRHFLLIGGAVAVTMVGIAIGIATSNNAKCGTACTVTSATGN